MISGVRPSSFRSIRMIILLILLAVSMLLGIAIGPVRLTLAQVIHGVFHPNGSAPNDIIVSALREPRVVCAALVGAALSVSGVIVQSVFKNPMADPGILGVSSGGTLGAVIALALGWDIASPYILPLCAFLLAGLSVTIVYLLATRSGRTSLIGVLLAGLVVSSMIGAAVSLVLTLVNNESMRSIVFWLLGGFDGDGWSQVGMIAPPILLGIVIVLFYARPLDLLHLGEDNAYSSGVSVEWTKRILITLVAVMTGAAVSVSGMIGFVGLLVPHMARRLVGSSHALLIPASALLGASLLILADMLGRSIDPLFEINVGVVTSFLGGPFFLTLLLRTERKTFR
ncbi:FecCD family ABC transporter permease [Ferroacidibacillus organovorans]|uniref:Iron ABC transporter n=1 Tax=Ferroacidibacillus organovorans TaxID=1765683 RepID=A0A162SVY6_9BACL|nr:iron ABC transporter permease [Ferroacidibacillus organovorans]KYP80203.1 hypothetical protein AYJ22_02905 [Ferroacidibacillus organovorans]OAG95079.1 hypothetical protein AYW79_02380 [Ferroacidibacillus organovorans]OPG17600.1 hypothetical protein B2M26_00120 [Ferroacidibacillus organovorans]